MAKELPYFRNTVQEWQNGKISTMPYSYKGLFWDICNYYWAQNCNVTEEMLSNKFKSSSKTIQKLIKNEVFCVQNAIVSISFLDQQLSELNQNKSKLSEWGKLGQKAKKRKAPLKKQLSYKDKDNDKEKDKDKILEKKCKYLDTVFLSDIEYKKLTEKHGKNNVDILIEILDNYKDSNGKKYKSDYKAMLSWVIDRAKSDGRYIRQKKELTPEELDKLF